MNEVGRLLRALAEENKGDDSGSGPAPVMPNRARGGHEEGPDRDSDLTSKSTGSTKGSPDWSLTGTAAGPEPFLSQPQWRGGGGGILVTTKPRTNPASALSRGVIFAQPPQSRGGLKTLQPSPAPNATWGASSSSLSKSPFLSRLLFRRAQNNNHDGVPELERERWSSAVGTLQRSASKASRATSQSSTMTASKSRKPSQQRSCAAAAAPSARIPVGKRRSRRHFDRDYGNGAEEEEFDEDNEEASVLQLQQLYDLRTWDLYMRITEARQLREQQKQQQQQQLWSHHIPHARPYVEPEDDPYGDAHHHHNDASTEPTSSPDSDYGWYDDYHSQRGRSATSARATTLPPNGTALDNSHELIFGDPEL